MSLATLGIAVGDRELVVALLIDNKVATVHLFHLPVEKQTLSIHENIGFTLPWLELVHHSL